MCYKTICRLLIVIQSVGTLFLALPVPSAHAAITSDVYISEVAWAGSALSTSDEWLELGNASSSDVSIGGWKIFGAGSSDKTLILPDDAIIAAHGVYIISNYPMDDAHCALTVMSDVVTSTLSLSNSTLHIELQDADGDLIDMAGDGDAPPAGYSQEIKASMIRIDPSLSGDNAEVWITADTSQNLYTSDFGTPGIIDLVFTDEPSNNVEQDNATSTDVTAPNETTTTTEITLEVPAVTSTEVTPIQTQEFLTPTSTATTTIIEVNIQAQNNNDQISTTSQTITVSDSQYLRLSEVMPYPAIGNEWIEITSVTPDRTISLEGLGLYDVAGKFATLHGEVSSTQPYFVYHISSSRLNNSGDDIYLKTSDGAIIDSFHYADVNQGVSWAKDHLDAWRETITPTQNAVNVITSKEIQVTQTADDKQQVAEKSSTTIVKATTPKTTSTKKETAIKPVTKTTSATKVTVSATTTSAKKSTKTTTAATKPKITTSSSSAIKSPLTIDYDMLQDDTYGNLRVKLQGSVGSVTGLLTGRAFALINQDGRGIAIRLPTGRKAPNLNSYVEVTGTLKFDTHDLPYISMTKNDTWLAMTNIVSIPKTRDVFLGSPSAEDAWSLVTATGTVQEVTGSTVKLIVDDQEINIRIKSGVDYRASRLKKGDTITVLGLLDISGEVPAILPRNAKEISLVSHTPEKLTLPQTATSTGGLPGWAPFGAALGAIGAIEGVKKVRSRKKIKTVTTTVVREV